MYEKIKQGELIAKVVQPNKEGLAFAGQVLRDGGNVAFPTETVYGLGGNALDTCAVGNIFVKKGRPLTDPLIVHVLDADKALALVKAEGVTKEIFSLLAGKFWPGPLTMVVEAAECIPSLVCAGTGFVGVRCPAHPIARALLESSNVPIAAPSANRFGHVSPTSAQHVIDDLGGHDIVVIDGDAEEQCTVGIESTVLKVSVSSMEDSLTLFRKGGVSEVAIREALDEAGFTKVKIETPPRKERPPHTPKDQQQKEEHDDEVSNVAPGQLLTHYAPDVDTWLVQDVSKFQNEQVSIDGKVVPLKECVILDFGQGLANYKSQCLDYKDLSPKQDILESAQKLFEFLRWTESTNAKHVLILDVSSHPHDLAPSVADRMYRASSGKIL